MAGCGGSCEAGFAVDKRSVVPKAVGVNGTSASIAIFRILRGTTAL